MKPTKPLQINPIKHSQPMGAALAFMGIKNTLPLMHGAQGCASFTKVFYTRHFNEPIAIYNTSVSDITAVLDGGDYSILLSIENIQKKNPTLKTELIGLHTTGLTETKGDDVRGVGKDIEIPYCYVNTPDFEGGMESGWSLTAKALISQHTKETKEINQKKLLILPNVSITPIEVEKVKSLCESFGFVTLALPDLSTSLDGYLSEGQGKLGLGAISIEDIQNLGDSVAVISIGNSMKIVADALLEKNSNIKHLHFNHLMGQDINDNLIKELMQIREIDPIPQIKRWRGRLQDAMLDTHFLIGSSKFVVTGEPDMCIGICEALRSVGGVIEGVITTVDSPILKEINAKKVIVGDLEDSIELFEEADLIISNFHAKRLADKKVVFRGYPNYEELGNGLKSDLLYEGTTYFLFEIANRIKELKH